MTVEKPDPPSRLLPDLPLPPYAHSPGRTPHPRRDPVGHGMPAFAEPVTPLIPDRWRESTAYLHGIDLFNSGYFWEAHEAWEALWAAGGRDGAVADFLKALIALAASGVKARAGNDRGVQHHARRAERLFRTLAGDDRFCGLDTGRLTVLSESVAAERTSFDAVILRPE